MILFFKEGLW